MKRQTLLASLLKQLRTHPGFAIAFSVLWLAVVGWIAFGWKLGSVGLIDETEPLFAEASRQMYETGDWVTPYFNGETRFDKPPLVYWLMAIAFHLAGVSEWTVRLPSAIAATALTALGFYVLRRFGFAQPNQATAITASGGTGLSHQSQNTLWLSAFIGSALIALNPETIAWAHIGVSDMLLSGCMGAALLAFFMGYAQPEQPSRQTKWYFSFYVGMALAVLAKGPVGVVLPSLIVIGFLLYVGRLREVLAELRLLPGLLLFLLITVPWYVLVILANGRAYIDSFFGYHNLDRFTSVVNGHSAPWFFYFLVVFVGFVPWSIFLPQAIARLQFWRVKHWRRQPRSAQLGLFALAWFLGIFIFFTVAVTKLPSYVLPLMPAAAILVALLWSDRMVAVKPDSVSWGFGLSVAANLALMVALAGAALYSPNWMGDDPSMPNLPDLVQQSGIMLHGAVIWAVAAVVGLLLVGVRQGRWLWSVNLVAFVAFVGLTMMPALEIADSERQWPLRQIAATIVAEQPNEAIVMTGFKKPSLVFYTQRPVNYLYSAAAVEAYLEQAATPSVLLVGRSAEIAKINPGDRQATQLLAPEPYELIRLTR
ncbi:ArnT family glycosyltransferase [Almyronema epifaneia]|uniref:ArnT family glycosyltransferase n=1 Tax=Almyronema epifaneia S1 TaxID=2991925 RepID=A0ABW6IK55_9CYAN